MKHNIAVAKYYVLPVLKLKYSQEFFTHIFKDYDNRFRVHEAIISMRNCRKCVMLIYKSNKTQHNNQHFKVFSSLSKWSNYKTGLDNFLPQQHKHAACYNELLSTPPFGSRGLSLRIGGGRGLNPWESSL